MKMWNTTCNATLEELRISPGSERAIAGDWTFHQLALVIGGASTIITIIICFYLMLQHAMNYTKPREQKHILRIILMMPIYAVAQWLSIKYYYHYIYFDVLSSCYEAVAISSFFALMCHYTAPDLHEQKHFFRMLQPITPWVWPINWFRKCCGGERGPWRTPRSGLTWFNIIWVGIYHYCFIRVAMTITAVVTQYFDKYCESSNSPVFAHIWILAIESMAVFIAMYCVIQFYIQLRKPLEEHEPFLKVLSMKLVIFLSFWQSTCISIGTSTLDFLQPNETLAYPDIKVVIPALLLCVELMGFAVLHLWAYPWHPYRPGSKTICYPLQDPRLGLPPGENTCCSKQGGPLGLYAFWDTMNIWDIFKAFGRGMRWLFVGVKSRRLDVSYQKPGSRPKDRLGAEGAVDMENLSPIRHRGTTAMGMRQTAGLKSTDHLPIASEFRRSQYGPTRACMAKQRDESEGLIAHAQPTPRDGTLLEVSPVSGETSAQPHALAQQQEEQQKQKQQQQQQQQQPQPQPKPQQQQHQNQQQQYPPHYHQQHPRGDLNGDERERRQSLSTVEEESYGGSSRRESRLDMHERTATPHSADTWDSAQTFGNGRSATPRNSSQLKFGHALWRAGPGRQPGT